MSSKVLVADDSAFARRALRRMLEERGIECIEACDGEEALAIWREHRPALVLLDLNMPKTTGYQVLESIKKEDSDSIVIVVSADVQPKARERVVALGARAMVRKPLDKEKIEAILAVVEQRMATLEPTSNAAQPASPIETLDPEQLDALAEIVNVGMGQAAAALAELLGAFLEISIPVSQSLEEYLQAQHRSGCAETCLLVQQAFTGDLRGEAIAVFDEKQMDELRSLLVASSHGSSDHELVLEMSNILIGAAITSIGSQLSAGVRFGRPSMLGRGRATLEPLCQQPEARSHVIITIGFRVEGRRFSVTLLIILPARERRRLQQALEAVLRTSFGG
jgi:CheY-like chemotaxis protein